jgi:FHS family L-fucose permease-like MFS transporter
MGKLILRILLPYGAFGVFILINSIGHNDLTPIYYYGFVIAIIILAEYLSKGNPGKQLGLFSALGIIALLIGMFSTGIVGIYAIVSVGLFASTLWPCIFTLALGGLGNYTGKGSGYLIMMILGGGIISLAQGFIAELSGVGIRLSFFIGVACFAYLLFYAVRSQSILKKQGVKIAE